MKKYKWESILILIFTIFILWFVLKDNFETSIKLIFSSNLLWISLAVFVYIIQFLIEAYIIYILINQYDKKYTYFKTVKLNFITKFFNGVTPFSSGGQPFQILELTKDGMSVSDSAVVIVEDFIFLEIAVVIISLINFILAYILNLIDFHSLLWTLTIIGFIINFFILLITYFISRHMKLAEKTGGKILKFLSFIHIVKDKEASLLKWESTCSEYYNAFKALQENKKLMRKCILLNIIYMIIYFAIPFLVLRAVGVTNNNIFISIILASYIFICGSYIPLPGGTFGTEYAFIHYFELCIKDIFLSPALIIWRFLTYYLPMILGGLFYNLKKHHDLKKLDKN